MSDDWKVQVTIRGTDDTGREIMVNVRDETAEGIKLLLTAIAPFTKSLKAPPERGGSRRTQAPPKDIKTWDDVPACPIHKTKMQPRAWNPPGSPDKTVYFWSCQQRDEGGYCKGKVSERPTKENVDQYNNLPKQ